MHIARPLLRAGGRRVSRSAGASLSSMPKSIPAYPAFSDCTVEAVPDEPNVCFSFTVQAPKRYTFETWNLPVSEGGFVKVYTPGRSTPEAQAWPGVAEDMVREVVGNVKTPEEGPWQIEWKAGAPHVPLPFPMTGILTAMWGRAIYEDGPADNETTVRVENRIAVGMSEWLTATANAAGAKHLVVSTAPARFKRSQFNGPAGST